MDSEPTDQARQSNLHPAFQCGGPAKRLIRYIMSCIDERRYVSQHKRTMEAIEQLGELDGLLEALDITREQLAASTIPPLAARELVTAMIARIGVDLVSLPPSAMQLAELQCRSCENWKRCRRWLSDHQLVDDPPIFCANAELFQGIRR